MGMPLLDEDFARDRDEEPAGEQTTPMDADEAGPSGLPNSPPGPSSSPIFVRLSLLSKLGVHASILSGARGEAKGGKAGELVGKGGAAVDELVDRAGGGVGAPDVGPDAGGRLKGAGGAEEDGLADPVGSQGVLMGSHFGGQGFPARPAGVLPRSHLPRARATH